MFNMMLLVLHVAVHGLFRAWESVRYLFSVVFALWSVGFVVNSPPWNSLDEGFPIHLLLHWRCACANEWCLLYLNFIKKFNTETVPARPRAQNQTNKDCAAALNFYYSYLVLWRKWHNMFHFDLRHLADSLLLTITADLLFILHDFVHTNQKHAAFSCFDGFWRVPYQYVCKINCKSNK